MTEEAEVEANLSPASRSVQQTPHFLRDVIFHGKLKRKTPAAATASISRMVSGVWTMSSPTM
ncbi:hypothetical protein INR49_025047 [Caranx melampygus]|nr:hypothetical protein INR49_025047 [Caranx melampygus]